MLNELYEEINDLINDINNRVADRAEYTQGYVDALLYVRDMVEEML